MVTPAAKREAVAHLTESYEAASGGRVKRLRPQNDGRSMNDLTKCQELQIMTQISCQLNTQRQAAG